MDSAEGDGGNGFLVVAEGGGHGGATHGHGAQERPQPDILQKSYEKFMARHVTRQLVLEIIVFLKQSSF